MSGVGCHIGDRFFGSLGYADDVCLISPNRDAICKMLKICENYGDEYNVLFNSQKSHLLLFNLDNVRPLYLKN